MLAQEQPSPEPSGAASSPPVISAPATVEPPVLIPAPPLPITGPAAGASSPELSQLDALFKSAPLGKETAEYRLHVEWRKLTNRTSNDAAVLAARTSVQSASTDLIKRERLRIYYQTLYSRMLALASPEMRAYLEGRRNEHIGMLAQPRVRPTPIPSTASLRAANRPRLP